MLKKVCDLMNENGYPLGNADCTVIAQAPKLSPHIYAMRENIARTMGCDISQINVKATTEEGLGLKGEGIGATCVCLLMKIQ